MKELFVLMAGIMPKEDLVKQLKESITEFEINDSEDNWNSLTMTCMLIATKRNIDSKEGSESEKMSEFMKDLDRAEKGRSLLNTDKN
jgi:hypothetical protein